MKPNSRKCIIICCIVTIILLLLLIVTLVILYFTIFKPKQPEVIATPVSLKHVNIGIFPKKIFEVTLGIDIFVKNRNYEGFKYGNTNTSVYYRGNLVAQAPIAAGEIGARATQNISTVIDLNVDKVISNFHFVPDVLSGMVNLTSSSTLVGDVILLKIIKLHATSSVNCETTVFVWSRNSSSNCVSTIKF